MERGVSRYRLCAQFLFDGAFVFRSTGFVIYGAYRERIHSVRDLARFQFLRFARLYPVHLLFLAAFAGVETLK